MLNYVVRLVNTVQLLCVRHQLAWTPTCLVLDVLIVPDHDHAWAYFSLVEGVRHKEMTQDGYLVRLGLPCIVQVYLANGARGFYAGIATEYAKVRAGMLFDQSGS